MKYSYLEKACKIVKGGVSNKTACLCQKLSSFFAFLVISVDSKKNVAIGWFIRQFNLKICTSVYVLSISILYISFLKASKTFS